MIAAHGLTFDAVADDGLVIDGQPVKVTALAQNRGASDVTIADAATGLRFYLQRDLMLSSPQGVLASEPDIFPERMQLLTDGRVIVVRRDDERSP